MTKKVVLITGANKGIGYEVARQLADNEFIVLLGARDLGRGKAAAKKLRAGSFDVHFVLLDITDEQSIQSAAEMVTKQWGKVDVLVNNAGIFPEYSLGTRPSLLEVSIFKDTFETGVGECTMLSNRKLYVVEFQIM